MSVKVQIGPMSDGDVRRLVRYMEAASSGERAQGKADDPLRTTAEILRRHGGAATSDAGFTVTLPDDDDDTILALRESLIREGIAHRLEQSLEVGGLTEEVIWHTHGDHDHEHAVIRTRRGEVALLAPAWGEMAVISSDTEIRERLNDYFFADGNGHEMSGIPDDLDDEVSEEERLVEGIPVLLGDEWAMVARYHGDLELRGRLNDLFAGRRELGGSDDADDIA